MNESNPADTPVPTPENTPVPGGGSWHWDAVQLAWAANPPYGEVAIVPADAAQPQPVAA